MMFITTGRRTSNEENRDVASYQKNTEYSTIYNRIIYMGIRKLYNMW